MTSSAGTQHADLVALAETARTALAGSRSDRLHRLFDYLLARTLDDDPPSEQQIAAEVFADDPMPGRELGANVRVYVHRLRKALDTAFADSKGPRLIIHPGEYRLVLGEDDAAAEAKQAASTLPARAFLRPFGVRPGVLAAAAAALVICLGAYLWWARTDARREAPSFIGQVFDQGDRPLVIVMGDYYMFGDLTGTDKATQLVWDEKVPTREDLTILQMLEPAHADDLVDYSQQFATGGTIEALSMLRTSVQRFRSLRPRAMRLVASSELTPEMLKCCDIIYVGQISGMAALLRDPLVQASGFRIDSGFGGLVDKTSMRAFLSDGMNLIDNSIPRRDYAYLATFPGPAGNQLMMISGLGEAGLKEAVHLAADSAQRQGVAADPSAFRKGFELLYRVRTIGNVNVGATLVLGRSLRAASIWDDPGKVAPYRPLDASSGSR